LGFLHFYRGYATTVCFLSVFASPHLHFPMCL
jgi:hypothetical protein